MKKHNFAFIDLETTGLDPTKHEILEIGLVLTKPNLEVLDEWEVKVKPMHIETAEREALAINGYTAADWLFAIDLKPALEMLVKKTADATMVAQNITFDWAFLQHHLALAGVTPKLHYHRLDLMSMAFATLYNDPAQEKFSLRALAERYAIKNDRAHSALADTRVTYQIFKKLLGR